MTMKRRLNNRSLPEANYEIILHFAELDANSKPGDRVFDISLEGGPRFQHVDIMKLVGAKTALTLQAVAVVLDGALSLSFSAVTGNPKLSAIEINHVGEHLAHAVASGPYTVVDVLGGGFASVTLDGTSSHTHAPGLSLINWTWFEGSAIIGIGEVTTLNLAVGEHEVTLRVTDEGGNISSATTTVTVLPVGYPVVSSLNPSSGFVTGGIQVTINGYGFNFTAEETVVHFGAYNLTGTAKISVVNATTINVLSIPATAVGVPVSVTVSTPISTSNAGTYTYINGVAIDWTVGNLFTLSVPTTLAFGPDAKLYVGTSDGKIAKLTLSGNNAVIESVISSVVNSNEGGVRTILGLTFDPMETYSVNPSVYVSHSKTFHGESKSSSGQAINGKVSLVSGANLDSIRDIITGLPVSDHDHAVNGLEFGDDGELYIVIGGNTNGGVPGPLSGSQLQKESVLSSAALVAYLSDSRFNGSLTYDAPDNGNLNPGASVEVFAAGLRNPFDIVLHSNKKLYATDNGPNLKYGGMSTSCTEGIPDIEQPDKLHLLVRGGYYGHANRKRGEVDPRQCVWHSALEATSANHTAPLAILTSSSDGIVEFQSDHFGKQMRGNLIVAMFQSKSSSYRRHVPPFPITD